jgi:drug/metabolite transporter (DMT)-like permease
MEFFMIAAIVAGLFFALRNIVNKYAIENKMQAVPWFYLYTALSLAVFPIISWSISPIVFPSVNSLVLTTIAASAAFTGGLIFVYALSIGDITTANPVLSTRPIFIIPLSYIFLREFYGFQIIGWILLIVLGAILTSWNEGMNFKNWLKNKSLGLFFATCLIFAFMGIASKPVLQEMDYINYLSWFHIMQIPLLLIFMPFVMKNNEIVGFKGKWKQVMPSAILEIALLYISLVAMFFALKFSVSLTEAFVATQGLFTVILGVLVSRINPKFLGENHSIRTYLTRLIGAALILVGVYHILF